MVSLSALRAEIKSQENPDQAKLLSRYFKTGKGQYGEGDIFIGLMVPTSRKIAKEYEDLSIEETVKLLKSKIHEERLIALFILTKKFEKGEESTRKKIYNIYLGNTKYINNWDLIDLSAIKIVGAHLRDKDRSVLYKLAKSRALWERRISVLSCFAFINHGQFDDALEIAEILVDDKHDLIHKAVGWMLREIGKKDLKAEESFLDRHYKTMPRTMLRYSIERFEQDRKDYYMGRS
ncbi:DNA alkylation repair protein [Pseudomonadota bacterium]